MLKTQPSKGWNEAMPAIEVFAFEMAFASSNQICSCAQTRTCDLPQPCREVCPVFHLLLLHADVAECMCVTVVLHWAFTQLLMASLACCDVVFAMAAVDTSKFEQVS